MAKWLVDGRRIEAVDQADCIAFTLWTGSLFIRAACSRAAERRDQIVDRQTDAIRELEEGV